eukprot:UN33966
MAASLTSSVAPRVYHQTMKQMTDQEVRELRWRLVKGTGKKAYVRFNTTLGSLNIQLFCDLVPQTCHSFLSHCESGYYTNTKFHRKITSFMIQGGDPTATGYGGKAAWGGKLKDECKKSLKHDIRGVVSMANSGPDTGGSQFFICFGAQPALDMKHTVFGQLVGGNEVLNKMEMVKCDDRDKPIEDIKITKIIVYKNPFVEPLPSERAEIDKEKEEEEERKNADRGQWWSTPGTQQAALMNTSIGKYLNFNNNSSNKRP